MQEQLKNLLREIEELRNKEKILIENFEKSTGELSKAFHYIIQAKLDGARFCCLTIDTCPTQSADELQKIGFEVTEEFNCLNKLCGYKISW